MSLSDKAREAREKASRSIDPADHALAHALDAAERAEFTNLIDANRKHQNPDTSGIPDPPIKNIRIPRPDVQTE